jgi:hypothetical protein
LSQTSTVFLAKIFLLTHTTATRKRVANSTDAIATAISHREVWSPPRRG